MVALALLVLASPLRELQTLRAIGRKVSQVRVGDRVVLKDVAGDDLFWEGKKYTLVTERELVGLAYE